MIKTLLAVILLCPLVVLADNQWKNPRVVDGDTIEFEVSWLPPELGNKLKVRVLGVDTPEKPPRAQCQQEADKAIKASAFTKSLIANSKNIKVSVKSWDKYGGRVLGDIMIDNKSLKQQLISNNLAREYNGEAKQSWCN